MKNSVAAKPTIGTQRRNISDLVLYAPDILENLGMKVSDFNKKNIIDIGAGFSLFSTYLAVYGNPNKLTFVDPIYQHQAIQELYRKNKKYFVNAPRLIENQKILESQKRQWLYTVKQNEKIFNLRERGKPSWKIVLNASSGEHIHGVEDNSQDLVIMQYLLNNISNSQMRIALLKEVERVMKYDGYCLSIHPVKCNNNVGNDFENIYTGGKKHVSCKKRKKEDIKRLIK